MLQLAFSGTAEGLPNRLRKLGWAVGNPLVVTELGLAVWEEVRKAPADDDPQESSEIYLDRDDPLAFIRLKRKIAAIQDEVFVVDPYFKMEQLEALADLPTLKRLLVSKKLPKAERNALSEVSRQLNLLLEIRLATNHFHDRWVIGSEVVYQLGVSFNGVGKATSTFAELGGASKLVRAEAEKSWGSADVLYSP